jgi:predicted nuclease of predicted toxin-antitoxin system
VSSLFICLYLDEDVNVLIANLLRAKGFDAITARDAGRLQATDAEQLAYAVSQARTLITHNRTDFEALVQTYFRLRAKALWCHFCGTPPAARDCTTLAGDSQSGHC